MSDLFDEDTNQFLSKIDDNFLMDVQDSNISENDEYINISSPDIVTYSEISPTIDDSNNEVPLITEDDELNDFSRPALNNSDEARYNDVEMTCILPCEIIKNDIMEIRAAQIYEVYSAAGVGKTELTMAIAARISKHGQVLYIDTKNDFNVTRMQSIAQNDFLPNILVAKAFHFEDATRLIENLAKANFEKTKLLIIDNIASIIWPILGGEEQVEVSEKIYRFQANIKNLACQKQIAVWLVNNGAKNATTPALGKFFRDFATTKLFINRQREVIIMNFF